MTSLDHKRIGVLYLVAVLAFFLLGSLQAAVLRVELMSPGRTMLSAGAFDKIFTLHGAIMVFLVLVPAIPAVLGNFLVPMMVGARDLAFPHLARSSFYLYVVGAVLVLVGAMVGGVDSGWTLSVPHSLQGGAGVALLALGVVALAVSSVFTSVNLIVTVHKLRAAGVNWQRVPLFVWGMYATSLVQLLAAPVLAATLLLLAIESTWTLGLFNPSLGGDPLLFQHLFWFYAHPAVYGMLVPGMAIVSEIIATFSRRKISGHAFVAGSMIAFGLLSFLGWGQHLFGAGLSDFATLVFSALSLLVAIPATVIVLNWLATLHGGSISFEAPMLYALAVILLATIGGLAGLFLAVPPLAIHLRGTYFEVAQLHYLLVGGTVFAFIGGLHYWWPKMFGKLYNERLAQGAFGLMFVGFNVGFLPQLLLGSRGMPRRYYDFLPEFQSLQLVSSIGVFLLVVGIILVVATLAMSLSSGERAPRNPWGAAGYEWETSSPPAVRNFSVGIVMSRGPYDFDGAAIEGLTEAPAAKAVREEPAAEEPAAEEPEDEPSEAEEPEDESSEAEQSDE